MFEGIISDARADLRKQDAEVARLIKTKDYYDDYWAGQVRQWRNLRAVSLKDK